jgi:hypothetical protein
MSYYTASDFARMVQNNPSFQPIKIMARDSSGLGRPGIINTLDLKTAYIDYMVSIMKKKNLFRVKDLVSANAGSQLEQLCKEAQKFRKEYKQSRNHADAPKMEITGKGPGCDDLFICLIMMAYWASFDDYKFY